MNASKNTRKDFVVSLILTFVFSVVISPVLRLPFSVGDDHRIIAMLHPEKMDEAYKKSLFDNSPDLSGSLVNDTKIGRFRPFGWLFTKLQCLLWGDNVLLWRISNIFLLFISLLLFIKICRELSWSDWPVWTIASLYAFGHNAETWWTLIPPAQNVGEVFLLSGILYWICFRKSQKFVYRSLSAIFLLISALVKESFIFCIPFIWIADQLVFGKDKLFSKNYYVLFFAFLLPFTGLLSVVIDSGITYSYPYPDSALQIIWFNIKRFLYSGVFLAAPLVLFSLKKRTISSQKLSRLILFTFIFIAVQLFLLKGIKMDEQHHYLMPGLLGILFLSVFALEHLKLSAVKIYAAVSGVYLLFAIWQVKNTFVHADYYRAKTESFYSMMYSIKYGEPDRIIYVSHLPYGGDWLPGTSAILKNEKMEVPLYFCSVAKGIESWEGRFMKNFPSISFQKLEPVILEKGLSKGDFLIFPNAEVRNGVFPYEKMELGKTQLFESDFCNLSLKKFWSCNEKVGYAAVRIP